LSVGTYTKVSVIQDVLLYGRAYRDEHLFVFLNFSHADRVVEMPGGLRSTRILLSTYGDREGEEAGPSTTLRPNEGIVVAE
jgi:alpha-glucosidase